MNKKLSGAKLVLVPVTCVGRNKFPYIEDLKGRTVKYIDFYPCRWLPGTADEGLATTDSLYVTLADSVGNSYLVHDLPLSRFDYAATCGLRQPVGRRISLQNSYLTCQDASAVGKAAAFVFWYDLPEFSARNRTDDLLIDSVTVPLASEVRHNPLPDEERMARRRFRHLWLATPTVTPDYRDALTADQLKNLYITLRKGAYNVLEDVPLWLFHQLRMMDKLELANITFDFQSSYLTIGGAGTIPRVKEDYIGKTVFFNLAYER